MAIELAAARCPALGPAELAARLDGHPGLLSGGPTRPGRHQSLEALVTWSYELLDEADRRLLDRLSVLRGGFDLGTAERVAAGGLLRPEAIAGLLASLAGKSPVRIAGVPCQDGQQVAAQASSCGSAACWAQAMPSAASRAARRKSPRWNVDQAAPSSTRAWMPGAAAAGTPVATVRTGLLRCTGRWRSTTGRAGQQVPVPPAASCPADRRLAHAAHPVLPTVASADRASLSAQSSSLPALTRRPTPPSSAAHALPVGPARLMQTG